MNKLQMLVASGLLSAAAAACDEPPAPSEPGALSASAAVAPPSAAPSAAAPPSPFDALGITVTLPEGVRTEADGSSVSVTSADGETVAHVQSSDEPAYFGRYGEQKSRLSMLGDVEWPVDEDNGADGWALEHRIRNDAGTSFGVDYLYVVGDTAVRCTGATKAAANASFLRDVCANLAPKPR